MLCACRSIRALSPIIKNTTYPAMASENGVHPESRTSPDVIWSTYLDAAKTEDQMRPKDWEGSTSGILTFVRTNRPPQLTLHVTHGTYRLVYSLVPSLHSSSRAISYCLLIQATKVSRCSPKSLSQRQMHRPIVPSSSTLPYLSKLSLQPLSSTLCGSPVCLYLYFVPCYQHWPSSGLVIIPAISRDAACFTRI